MCHSHDNSTQIGELSAVLQSMVCSGGCRKWWKCRWAVTGHWRSEGTSEVGVALGSSWHLYSHLQSAVWCHLHWHLARCCDLGRSVGISICMGGMGGTCLRFVLGWVGLALALAWAWVGRAGHVCGLFCDVQMSPH